MNATVSARRHANVLGQESKYVVIKTEKGSVMIKSGESTLRKLEEIGIIEDGLVGLDNDAIAKKKKDEMAKPK